MLPAWQYRFALLTYGLLSLLLVFVVLPEQQGAPDAYLPPGWATVGVIPVT